MTAADQRNVLMLSIDALRSDCIGANKDKRRLLGLGTSRAPTTPNLDAFLNTGATFTNAFSAAPYTSASHASIFTGLFTSRHGVREHFRTAIRENLKTIFSWYKEAGYVTILATDMPAIFRKEFGFTRDVDHYVVTDDNKIAELLKRHDEQPVFCFWHLADIHMPYGLTSLEIDGARFTEEVERIEKMAGNTFDPEGARQLNWTCSEDETEIELRNRYIQARNVLYQTKRYGALMDLYVESIEHLDKYRFPTILDVLKERGWIGCSDIAVFGDHGEEYSDRCLMHQNSIVHGAVNVPITMISPDLPAGGLFDGVVRTIDIAPTLSALSGIVVDQAMDGNSLLPHIVDQAPIDQIALGEMFHYDAASVKERHRLLEESMAKGRDFDDLDKINPSEHKLYAVDKRWKLIIERNLRNGEETMSLYEREIDLFETQNSAKKFPRVVKILRDELAILADENAQVSPGENKDILDRIGQDLRNMGYLTSEHND